MTQQSLYEQINDYANRANPYPLYARMRQTPVARQADGSYVVSTYREIVALLHDPRISSDLRKRPPASLPSNHQPAAVNPAQQAGADQIGPGQRPEQARIPGFIHFDPPEHERVRRQAMWPFGPPHRPERVAGMESGFVQLVNRQIDTLRGKTQIDIVDEFAYPIPVTVICELLGVPRADEPRFHVWAEAIIASADMIPQESPQEQRRRQDQSAQAIAELRQYIATLIERHRRQPGPDLLSELITGHGPDGSMALADIVDTGILLLFAGHETTVNLIANGVLTLLRHPDVLERLRREPGLIIRLVEELLRYEPPVHFLTSRTALADIAIAGTTIPRGATVILLLASGSRDPDRFRDPERFDPDREDNVHLGFGSGIHYCYGAPLARLEAQIALTGFVRRIENPRLMQDPPSYRQSAILRGPRQLFVEIDGVRD